MEIEVTEKIQKANLIEKPLDLVPNFKKYKSNTLEFQIESCKSCCLDNKVKTWIFDLFERNMKTIYEKSKSGWNKKEKLQELFDERAYYILVYNLDSPIGYCHYRFDMDFDNEVIYCYELQIEDKFRRFGLGKFMMDILECLCENLELEKVMLTVSKYNQTGLKFFKEKMKYTLDETDLNDDDPSVDYEILSKVFWEDEED
ncbi:unnamed protein product [Brachionus calyciflorus]|uniref:N-alpha-acetyltransferase 40 n=1 Tax=Brachionus calyciflorus TaxID=104777 RepID=A0A813M3K8_9BILA|nr:unnamed protein product [Brachionus calyciflorus]